MTTDTKHIHIITWLQMNRPSYSQESTVCTKQDLEREWYAWMMVRATQFNATGCYHTFIVYQVCHDVGRCVKSGRCSLSSLKWKVKGQSWWNTLLSQQMLAVIKTRCRRQISFAFQKYSSCMHQCMVHATQFNNFISPELWPKQAKGELSWLQDSGSLQKREYELQVKQRLV